MVYSIRVVKGVSHMSKREQFITDYLELVSPRPTRTEAEMMYHEFNVSDMTYNEMNTFLTVFCTSENN